MIPLVSCALGRPFLELAFFVAFKGIQSLSLFNHWRIVKNVNPSVYYWDHYLRIVDLVGKCGLKIRVSRVSKFVSLNEMGHSRLG